MASTIWSFLKIFGPRAARTSTAPNSRAAISLWRRCFELKEKQEEETLEEIVRALESEFFDGDATNPPIRSFSATAAREQILADYYRTLVTRRQPTVNVATPTSTGTDTSSRSLDSQTVTMPPSLLIPTQDVNPDYIYLPQ